MIRFADQEGVLNNILFFSCYSDDIISFEIHKNGFVYEISAICDAEIIQGDTLLSLINLKPIFFFSIRKFELDFLLEEIMYTQPNTKMLN